jgi:hypothetical protein
MQVIGTIQLIVYSGDCLFPLIFILLILSLYSNPVSRFLRDLFIIYEGIWYWQRTTLFCGRLVWFHLPLPSWIVSRAPSLPLSEVFFSLCGLTICKVTWWGAGSQIRRQKNARTSWKGWSGGDWGRKKKGGNGDMTMCPRVGPYVFSTMRPRMIHPYTGGLTRVVT